MFTSIFQANRFKEPGIKVSPGQFHQAFEYGRYFHQPYTLFLFAFRLCPNELHLKYSKSTTTRRRNQNQTPDSRHWTNIKGIIKTKGEDEERTGMILSEGFKTPEIWCLRAGTRSLVIDRKVRYHTPKSLLQYPRGQ
ncbi:hypothetical protein KQX54_018661 [Cotesia glomerata]|uniref:Uncharacterized protein n=1 Tax=Cotesia glomerata TaxID=32391 RepID=A0AAV7HTB1_COTGL|nr:hypothetical protein KQX54_018661 [Cotesia glomerata]